MYKLLEEQPNAVRWVGLVRNLLNITGLGDYWYFQCVGNTKIFLSLFKERITDIYYQQWNEEVANTSSYRLFKSIKSRHEWEPYLQLKNKGLRMAITKIRLSSHLFMIERGRWAPKAKAKNERLCNV